MSMYVIDPPSEPDELGLGQTLDTIQKIVEGDTPEGEALRQLLDWPPHGVPEEPWYTMCGHPMWVPNQCCH